MQRDLTKPQMMGWGLLLIHAEEMSGLSFISSQGNILAASSQ